MRRAWLPVWALMRPPFSYSESLTDPSEQWSVR
jgi:hypothetical protein